MYNDKNMVKQTLKIFSCEHHKMFKVFLTICQIYLWKGVNLLWDMSLWETNFIIFCNFSDGNTVNVIEDVFWRDASYFKIPDLLT